MGWDYALVHAKFTIPPAVFLTLLYRPLLTRRDVYRIAFLVTIAVTSTIPWDSYLIRTRIWTYPDYAVLGPTIFHIPLEELFFFIIQTYDVSLLYLIYSKPSFFPAYLQQPDANSDKNGSHLRASLAGMFGQVLIFIAIVQGYSLVQTGGHGTYFGLIVIWAMPFILILWSFSSGFILRISTSNMLVPIVLPTLYLWMVDTFSLQRGTWVIEQATKSGINLWPGLEIEEAFFFFITNTLIVFGQIAFENAVTILDTFESLFPKAEACPSILTAIKLLSVPVKNYDEARVEALTDAVSRLGKKSRSFFLASATFQGRLRIDLILLYSFCRVADDLVDAAESMNEAESWIEHLRKYLDLAYSGKTFGKIDSKVTEFVRKTFPKDTQSSLLQLPVTRLSSQPLYDLLKGFEMDILFATNTSGKQWPIGDERALEQYGEYVAGTVAELCCDLVFFHHGRETSTSERNRLKISARRMGVALQTVNIARDFSVDAQIGRVYIPSIWLKEANLSPQEVLKDPVRPEMAPLRSRLLRKAFNLYDASRPALDELPRDASSGMKVAIESYMEIGRVLKDEEYAVYNGKATVALPRRLWVAWKALNS